MLRQRDRRKQVEIMKRLAPLAVLAAGVFWGMMGLFVRTLNAAGLAAMEVVEVRMLGGLVIVGIYMLIFCPDQFRIRLKDLWCFLGTGVVSVLVFSFCYFRAMNFTSLSVAAVLLYTAPIFVMLMSILLFREKLTVRKVLALILAFVGCVLVSGIGSDAVVSLPGLLFGVGSGFFYALYSIFGRYAINRGYHSWTITFYSFLFCVIGGAFLVDWDLITTTISADYTLLFWILGMAVVTGFLAYVLYSLGLEHMESSKASIIASIEPVVGTLLGVFVFREAITVGGVIGVALVLGGIAILSVPGKRQG